MNAEPFDEFEDKPWTEAQWEKSMRESDVKSAKFGELLETLIDHPDRDEIISREMGWDVEDEGDDGDEAGFEIPLDVLNAEPSEEIVAEVQRSHEELEELPVYARSREWAMTVWNALDLDEAEERAEPEDVGELRTEAVGGAMRVAAKIAGGHGMGYDDDVLCGNIVCCKRALEAAEESLQALEELRDGGHFPAETLRPLIEEGRVVREMVEARIAELRSRVWWE